MTISVTASGVGPKVEDIPIIDCDSHLTEPPDLWVSRAPAAMKGRVPVQKTIDGETHWYLDDEPWANTGGNTVRRGREKLLGGYVIHPFDDIDPSAWSVKDRLEVMDLMGVEAQILYPNGIGFSSNHIFAIDDDEQRTAVLQMYNDFLLEVQHGSSGRLYPQGLLPIWDIDLTVREMERLIGQGMTGFTLSDKPELLGLPELPEPYFDPMWDMFNESGSVAAFHVGSGRRREETEAMRRSRDQRSSNKEVAAPASIPAVVGPAWRSFGPQRSLALYAAQMFMSNFRLISNLCMSDLFDRYGSLKIASAESGIGWVPFMLEALEHQLDEMVSDPGERSLQQRRPTEYFRDHVYVMFWFESLAPSRMLEEIGVENVLVETDFPHPTCLYPGAREHFASVLKDVPAPVRLRVLRDNAASVYQIPVGR